VGGEAEGDPTGEETDPLTPPGEEGEEPAAPEGAQPMPEGGCPSGTDYGTFNGQEYCAPTTPQHEESPPTNPTETDPTGLGPKVDAVKDAVDKNTDAVKGVRDAINEQGSILADKISKISKAGGGGGDDG